MLKSNQLRTIALLLCISILPVSFGFKGCGPDESGKTPAQKATPYVERSVRVMEKAVTIFKANGLPTKNLETAIALGKPLIPALKSNASDVLSQAGAFIDAFEVMMSDVNLIKDQRVRTIILVALFVADEALHDFADQLELPQSNHELQDGQAKAVESIKKFKAKPRLVCRASGPIEKYKAGQFAPMAICKKYPDQTVVERYQRNK